ncbi:hypothetical protein TIFTF001_034092 [Ficus carica]|uniref:Uncharacterized protein n=1 Tax=Ficus carica TaxID=3494 RepID=A0AA88J819_FICCA|nr:hypothetical protein TIFTF001_034092 [Ficus carica]
MFTSVYFLVIFLAMTSTRAEARGPFQCPRMIDCSSVCQGFPNCCVSCQCICQPCSSIPLPHPIRSSPCPADDVNCRSP